jgi:hypothetical protein
MNSGKVAGISPYEGKAIDYLPFYFSTPNCRCADYKRLRVVRGPTRKTMPTRGLLPLLCRAINAIIGVAAAFRLRTMTQAKACDYHRQKVVDVVELSA